MDGSVYAPESISQKLEQLPMLWGMLIGLDHEGPNRR